MPIFIIYLANFAESTSATGQNLAGKLCLTYSVISIHVQGNRGEHHVG